MTEATEKREKSEHFDPDCELCLAHKLTPWLHEDDLCWIAECMICATPMIVWRHHGMPDEPTKEQLMSKLGEVSDAFYQGKGWWPDNNMRNIPDHWHCHARPAGGFFGHR